MSCSLSGDRCCSSPQTAPEITLEIISDRFRLMWVALLCLVLLPILFVLFLYILCSVCFAYQSVRNQTQKCCVILHCRQQQQKQHKTKETERKKSCTNHFIYGSVAVFGYRFGLATFMLWLQLLLLLLVVAVAAAAACAIETRWRCMLGAYVCLNASGQKFFESPKRW